MRPVPRATSADRFLDNILDGAEPIRVIARDPLRLPPRTRERVEVVQGSHSDIEIVASAFEGADTVFWLVPADQQAESVEAACVDFSRPACAAFQNRGVKRVVGVSALGRGVTVSAGHVSASLRLDDLIASTGVSYRALTMPSFMDNILRQAEPTESQGVFSWPISGDLKVPTCATRDTAAAAARLLLDRSWSGSASVPVLGPEAVRSRLAGQGFSDAMAQAMVDMLVAKERGLDDAEPGTPQATTPTSFRQWCEEVLKPAVSS